MNLKIRDKNELVNKFLNVIGRVTEDSIITISDGKLTSLNNTSDGTLIQYTTYNYGVDNINIVLNVPDIQRLTKVVSCIEDNEIDLVIGTNNISYTSNTLRFKYYLLEDGILSSPPISVDKIKAIKYDMSFVLPFSSLTNLLKGNTFASETDKLYLYTDETGTVYGELTDRARHNVDSFTLKLSEGDGKGSIPTPIPINFENIRIISGTKCDFINVHINTQLSVVTFDLSIGDNKILYVVSALVA